MTEPSTLATDSHYSMLRGAIALAWADHVLEEEEIEQLQRYIQHNTQLSEAQKTQLLQDLHTPARLSDIWPAITDTLDRAHLINIAPVIFRNDGHYCETEQDVYERMYAQHMATLDTVAIEQNIMALAQAQKIDREAREAVFADWANTRPKHFGPITRLVRMLVAIF